MKETTNERAVEAVEVTQADRELFMALFVRGPEDAHVVFNLQGGAWDTDWRMKAIARHRIASVAAARVAIMEELREPTPAMLDAFVARALQVSVQGEGGWTNYARNQWQAMLDAAIRAAKTDGAAHDR